MKKPCEIIICGDLCPTKDTEKLFESEDEKKLFNNILTSFLSCDLLIGNLEFPIINNGKSINKSGPVFRGKDNFINVFKNAGFAVLSLANNHIKDCGEEGVLNTIAICKKNEITTVGAGANLSAAKKPIIKEINGWEIGIMSFAEQEFNIATETNSGANYLDVYDDFDTIKALKRKVDYLIILYHGGIEYYKYPSPLLQKKCRKMIASGADLVTCQHSHCIGTTETYLDGTIVYGQGNTLFGYRQNNRSWNEGLILKIKLENNSNSIKFVLIEAKKQGIKLMEAKKGRERLALFLSMSEKITNESFIHQSWKVFCLKKKSLYMPWIFGFNRLFIHLNRILKNRLVNLLFSSKRKATTLNLIRCEAHHEVISTLLENDTK